MTNEQWEYITNNWGASEESVLEEIAKIKDADSIERNGYEAKIAEREKEIQRLNSQNIDLNKTNMNLILRLTEPGMIKSEEKEQEVYNINDLDKLIKEV